MTRFFLDGEPIEAQPGETIRRAAARQGVHIPYLCDHDRPDLRADGNCRACVVEIAGERTLAASCLRLPSEGLQVSVASPRAEAARRGVFALLAEGLPPRAACPDPDAPFWRQAADLGVTGRREPVAGIGTAPVSPQAAGLQLIDASHAAIAVNLAACIACGLCVRACREVQVNDVIGMGFRGADTRPVFDLEDPLGASSCVGCGECVAVCPTGALIEKSRLAPPAATATTTTETVCPYCGVGCRTKVSVADDRIVLVEGANGPANAGRLCVKGRFGEDFVRHPHRLTRPLIRRLDAPKHADSVVDPANPFTHFREATWDEALDAAAAGFRRIRAAHGAGALAGFGSAKGTNEEAYLFQKLIRTGFGTNNVDHCTRLCHASSVAALLEGVGSGAVTAPFTAAAEAECIIVIGARPTENHPVAATFIKQAVARGAKLIVMDPRGQALMRHATLPIRFRAGTDVALLRGMLATIVAEGLVATAYVEAHVDGFEAFRASLEGVTAETVAPICNVPAATIRAAARLYAQSKASLIFWGMGVSQHVHGTDNARCLVALALLTGHVGRPGTGLHPLRGQNNVQGASDAGLIPMMYPDYQPVEQPANRARFEAAWGMPLDGRRGLTTVEILTAAEAGHIRGLYVMGENPAMSDPDQHHARAALAALDHLVVQDIFLTETAFHADVVLPASSFLEKSGTVTNTNRQVQLGRPVLPPPGEARPDLAIITALANRLGLGWPQADAATVYEEMRSLMPSLAGLPFGRLEAEGSVTYPAQDATSPGAEILFGDRFPTPSGRARLVPVSFAPPDEMPDARFPLVLTTGRLLEHWHTGTMTRRSRVLDAIEPSAVVTMHPAEIARHGLVPGARVHVETRRGAIDATLRADSDTAEGMVFMPFAFAEAAANLLTNPALDEIAKIPEVKFCAARVCLAAPVSPAV